MPDPHFAHPTALPTIGGVGASSTVLPYLSGFPATSLPVDVPNIPQGNIVPVFSSLSTHQVPRDAVDLGAAIDYVTRIGMDLISQYEHYLLVYATKLLKEIPGLRLIGTAKEKASVLSFVFDGFKTEEVGAALNEQGIAVRSGHHCAQPILRRFGLEATVRPSHAFYNTCADIDVLVETLYRLRSGHK